MSSFETIEQKQSEASDPGGPTNSAEPLMDSGIHPPERKSLRRRLRLKTFLLLACALVIIAVSGSFIRFAESIAAISVPQNPQADAIVVLTGGTERVAQAIRLLAENRAERLLISGVHPGTTVQQIASMTGVDTALFKCCIDLDRVALNTEGNAIETASWVHKHEFSSLLLVTSAYHLPRASVELQGALPGVHMIPYPVYSAELDLQNWYRQPATIRLLLREYVKYTVASLRIVGQHALNKLRP